MASISGREDASRDGPHQGLSQRRRPETSPPACPVCHDLRTELLLWFYGGKSNTRCGSVFEQKSCRICRYITDAILQLSKPLVADHVDLVLSLQSRRLSIDRDKGYTTSVSVDIADAGDLPLHIELYTPTGLSPTVNAFGTAPDRPPILDITTCTRFIKRNLEKCEASHPCCEDESLEMPTRLLFIGSIDSPCLRLTQAPSTKQKYVALSHCWGDQSGILKTTKFTLEERLLSISWNSLSKTFQDSIQITRSLDVNFLWIDSLCIVQDDPSDWEKESVKMAQVYSQAYLTIAAASASSGSVGCLFSRYSFCGKKRERYSTFHLQNEDDPCGHEIHARYASQAHGSFNYTHGYAPLWSRAWAFQERYLSRRTIHFHAEEMIWDCRESRDCECGYYAWREECGSDYSGFGYLDFWDTVQLRTHLSKAFRRQLARESAFLTWLKVVEKFAGMDITYQLDKLPALSGIASYLVPVMKSHCIAGIWEYKMATGLLWNNEQGCARSRRVENTATRYIPTWSWASLENEPQRSIEWPIITSIWNPFTKDAAFSWASFQAAQWKVVSFLTIDDAVLRVKGLCISCMTELGRPQTIDMFYMADDTVANSLSFRDQIAGKFHRDLYTESLPNEVICILLGKGEGDEDNLPSEFAIVLESCGPRMPGRYRRIGVLEIERHYGWFKDAELRSLEII